MEDDLANVESRIQAAKEGKSCSATEDPSRSATEDKVLTSAAEGHKPEAQVGSPVFIAILLILALAGGGYLWKQHADYQAYHQIASQLLDELEKIQAATETGINRIHFGEKVADMNYMAKKLEAYKGTPYEDLKSYRALDFAVTSYKLAEQMWDLGISDGSSLDYKNSVQVQWQTADEGIKAAKEALKQNQ